jgi:hypothetical protein
VSRHFGPHGPRPPQMETSTLAKNPPRKRARNRAKPKRADPALLLLMISDDLDVIDATLGCVTQLNHLARLIREDDSAPTTPDDDPALMIDVLNAPDVLIETIQWRLKRLRTMVQSSGASHD